MDKEHVKGAAEKVEGKVKEAIGRFTGKKRLENQGKADQLKGAAHTATGDAKDAAKEAAKHLKH
ncbi:MAG TPA: CsbD family protein [Acidobacteriaceae bacterium]|jgi:uncharacterized protein YjbJ (UPF0337 family)